MMYFEPQKGKAFENLPDSYLKTVNDKEYIVSTKYDGNQIFIHKVDEDVRFFTSDWKEFELPSIAKDIANANYGYDFVAMGEFMWNCYGKLGDRPKSAILTTFRTRFNKKQPNTTSLDKVNIRVFDVLELIYDLATDEYYANCFKAYESRLVDVDRICDRVENLSPIVWRKMKGSKIANFTKDLVNKGWEGTMSVEANSTYSKGKRVNHSFKLKFRKTADLRCIGIEPGEGKYLGMIGSLILKDSHGRVVNVGSGLDDFQRGLGHTKFLDKIIEISYEQIMDTYIQPTFICVRHDKHKED